MGRVDEQPTEDFDLYLLRVSKAETAKQAGARTYRWESCLRSTMWSSSSSTTLTPRATATSWPSGP